MALNLYSGQYVQRARGVYVNTSVAALGAQNELRLRPNTNRKQPSATATRYKQFEVTTSGVTKTYPVSVSLSINASAFSGLTGEQVVFLIQDLAAAMTADNVTTLLQGGTELNSALPQNPGLPN